MAETVRHPRVKGIRSEKALNRRACKALWGYITNTFDWAEEHGYIAEDKNPCRKVDPKKTFYRLTEEIEHPYDTVVIPPDQIAALNILYRKDHEEDPGYMPPYALEMASLTGMRAGEIVALKWEDIQGDYIRVRRRESKDKLTGKNRVKTTPKNEKPRSIPLTGAIRELLARVRKASEENGLMGDYIFTGSSGRITVQILTSCLRNRCKQLGIRPKGINAYRKTVNSLIRANGLSAEAASSMLGNSPAVNTQYYTFDVTEEKKKQAVLDKVNQFMLEPGRDE